MSTSGAAPQGGPPSGAAGGDLGGAYPNPGVTKLQGTPVSAVAPTNGQLFQLVGGVWTPASLVIPAAGATVTGPDAFGAAAVVGVSSAYSRADHDHGLPAAPVVPGVATTVTGPDAFGAAAAVGVSSLYARGDHDHGLPANPSAAFATPAIVLGTAAAAGVAGTKIRSDATIAAFDATVPVTQAYGDAAATGAAAVAARRDHRHGMPAAASLTSASSFITADVALAASTAVNVTSLSLAAGTWLVHGQALIWNTTTSSNETADLWLWTASAAGATTALGSASQSLQQSSATTGGAMLHFSCIVVPSVTTTYFLNAFNATAGSVRHAGAAASTINLSGLVAVKIG